MLITVIKTRILIVRTSYQRKWWYCICICGIFLQDSLKCNGHFSSNREEGGKGLLSGVEVRLIETLNSFKLYGSLNNGIIPGITVLHVADILSH